MPAGPTPSNPILPLRPGGHLMRAMLHERAELQARADQLARSQLQAPIVDEDDPCPHHLFPLDLTTGEDSEEGSLSEDMLGSAPHSTAGATGDSSGLSQGPPPCSWLSQGQVFHGFQRFSSSASASRTAGAAADDWQVSLQIHEFNTNQGYACGVMTAQNVPHRREPIVTFFEADIIDNLHHTFFTGGKWGASRDTDLQHWGRFPGFSPVLRSQATAHNGKSPSLSTSPTVYMRLKEQFFVNARTDCGLTIAGFYYVAVDRATGTITGYYYDPSSTPYQLIHLTPAQGPGTGVSFGSYEFR